MSVFMMMSRPGMMITVSMLTVPMFPVLIISGTSVVMSTVPAGDPEGAALPQGDEALGGRGRGGQRVELPAHTLRDIVSENILVKLDIALFYLGFTQKPALFIVYWHFHSVNSH